MKRLIKKSIKILKGIIMFNIIVLLLNYVIKEFEKDCFTIYKESSAIAYNKILYTELEKVQTFFLEFTGICMTIIIIIIVIKKLMKIKIK